jgi:hypothetical protein
MKRFACAATVALGLTAIAAPADAAMFEWTVEYTDFWSDGSSLTGAIRADEAAALDGIITSDEFTAWMWDWSGNAEVDAFSISSKDELAETQFDAALNLGDDPFAQGLFSAGDPINYSIDFDFLVVDKFNFDTFEFSESVADGDGSVAVSSKKVPEPATVMGLIALTAVGATVKRQKQAA